MTKKLKKYKRYDIIAKEIKGLKEIGEHGKTSEMMAVCCAFFM